MKLVCLSMQQHRKKNLFPVFLDGFENQIVLKVKE
jgi:hypothetical protein